ncbi:unnamed protein product [Calypogeia fissa]
MGIFEPFRALGYITDGIPFSVQRRGLETFVTVSVGKSWQIFNLAKISLVFVGPQLERKIRAIASWRDYTYVATGQSIAVFNRAHQASTWSAHNGKVVLLLAFGKHVLSVGTDGRLLIWPAVEADPTTAAHPVGSIQLRESFSPTCIMHPDTYLNKVLIGSEEGSLQLWNVSTQKMIYEFKGWGSAVRSCVSSPALDVVGVGCGDGKIHLHNLRYDETVVTFTHTSRGPVTALSFRTDGQPFLAAGGSSGVISIWDLEKKKLHTVIKDAHDGPITSLHFFANEPVLLSGGADNSLKMWIFDTSDGEGRLLRFRSGHSAPPTCIRYYGSGHHLLSAGLDRSFRFFSTVQDQQSRELSQGHVAKRARRLKVKEEEVKLSPVVGFAAAEIRARDWCNVVTCHMDDTVAYSWRLQNFVIGEHILKPCLEDPTPVKACAISACGNFAILGTEGGYIEKFNLQSGLNRGSYRDTTLEQRAHEGAIVGLACDATNTLLLSAGCDDQIKVWDFKVGELKSTITLGSTPVKIAYHPGNGLLAVASDDKVLRLYDVVAVRMVRLFQGHTDRITDLCFSEDGKWLVSSSMDETVRVWDVVAAKPLDAMHVDAAVTALTLSPNMDMLATAHVNRNGIYLWANRLIYSSMDVEPSGSGKSVVHVSMPTVSSSDGTALENEPSEAGAGMERENSSLIVPRKDGTSSAISQILPSLITLAMLPKSQWQALVNLDIIKVRNKPVEPPKKPERAPFFLPTLPSVSGVPTFVPGKKAEDINKDDNSSKTGVKTVSRFINSVADGDELQSEFIQTLRKCANIEDYTSLMTLVKGMTPSALDAELRILQIIDDDDDEHDDDNESQSKELLDIARLMDFFTHQMAANTDFEFLQAVVQLFLKIHGQTIIRNSLLQEKAKKLLELQGFSWQRLDTTFQKIRCTVAFLCNSQL